MSEDYKSKFPEKWLCPYCIAEGNLESECMVERDRIPTHLMYVHGWSEALTWEYIYNRLKSVGGIE